MTAANTPGVRNQDCRLTHGRPGESGNPAGRKPGSGEVAKLRATMAEHVPAPVAVLVERALSGDIGAAREIIGRIEALENRDKPDFVVVLCEEGETEEQALQRTKVEPGQRVVVLPSIARKLL